jgi:hypothetical protein
MEVPYLCTLERWLAIIYQSRVSVLPSAGAFLSVYRERIFGSKHQENLKDQPCEMENGYPFCQPESLYQVNFEKRKMLNNGVVA